jgi:hypothetical protein
MLPPLFVERRPPISRIRLTHRLRMLAPQDADELAAVEDLTHWHRLSLDATDEQIVAQSSRIVPSLQSPLMRDVATWRLELRSVVAALRRRAAGEPAPGRGEMWGYGRWTRPVLRNWRKPDFGLSGPLPWVSRLNDLIVRNDAQEAERVQLKLVWQFLTRLSDGHYFDFEAVALYVLRWDIIHRWTMYDSQQATERFNELRQETLGEVGTPPSRRLDERAEKATRT